MVVSLGGIFFFSLLAFALFCCIKKRKKKTKETEVIHFDEHKEVKETIVSGPFGEKTTTISVEDDIHFDEQIKKKEQFGHEHGLHVKSPSADNEGNNIPSSHEVATTSSGIDHQKAEHNP